MEWLCKIFRAPGARKTIECAAPTQITCPKDVPQNTTSVNISVEDVTSYAGVSKTKMLDRWLDKVVEASGSQLSLFTILTALFVWAFLGIPFGQSDTWQVTISDCQAVINLVFDAFLMRQQLNSHGALIHVAASLRSRGSSHKRILGRLIASGKYGKIDQRQFLGLEQTIYASELPAENWMGRMSTAVANFMGHIATVSGFWVGIFIWIGFGQYCEWSVTWQLYINSATSALLVLLLALLANIHERHARYTTKCLHAIWEVDAALELRLRTVSGDTFPNPSIIIPVPKRGRIQRGIDYYADLVGTLVGIAILIFFIVVWLAIGPALQFDTNWWLLNGTYAGLIGLNDGFVLRNVCTVLGDNVDEEFSKVEYDDLTMLALIGVDRFEEEHVVDNSLSCRISIRVGRVCSNKWTVVIGVLCILGLIVGASAMGWNETGQLLCNIPPSIIESFFTLILITGHNIGDAKRRVDLSNIYSKRLRLVSFVEKMANIEMTGQKM